MTSSTLVFWNSVTSGARHALSLAVLIVITPVIIHHVGTEDFGLWALTFSVLGFFGLLDLGFGSGAVKYVAECKGRGDSTRRNQLLSTLAVVYVCLGSLALLGTVLLGWFYEPFFGIPQDQGKKAFALLWILALRVAVLGLPLSLFRNILFGEQKIHWINLIQCSANLLLGAAIWLGLRAGYGIVAVAWLNLIVFLAENLVYMILAFRFVPGLRLAWSMADMGLFKQVVSFSLFAFVAQVAALILLRTDPIIVKLFLPLGAVAIYAVALKIVESLYLLLKQFLNVLTPFIAERFSRGENDAIRVVLVNGTKFSLSIALMIGVTGFVFGTDAVVLWIGPDFAEVGTVLAVLLASMVASMPQMTASAALTMTGQERFTARAAAISAGLNIVMSLLLAPVLGIIGIALGTLVATLVVDVFVVLRKACSEFSVPMRRYVRQAIRPTLLPAASQWIVAQATATWFPPITLTQVVLVSLPGVAVFGALFWLFSLEGFERDFIRTVFSRDRSKLIPVTDEGVRT